LLLLYLQEFTMKSQYKVAVAMGTRPEGIKLAPVIYQLKFHPQFVPLVINTGQHTDMLDSVLEKLEISVDYDLKVMTENQSLAASAAKILSGIEKILEEEKPDALLVQGDTTTALMCAIASFYQKIPVGHVEAGLRSFDKDHPFPEEMNRILLADLSTWAFCPSMESHANLLKESIPGHSIHVPGNTVIDIMRLILAKTENQDIEVLIPDDGKKTILVTVHRRENFGKPLEEICEAIAYLAHQFEDIKFVYPVHRNPNIKKCVEKYLGSIKNVHLLPPINYFTFLSILKTSFFVITDSGGVQEEAPVLGKPVLITRNVTERVEPVIHGVAKVVGTSKETIIEESIKLITNKDHYASMSKPCSFYGEGDASKKIVNILLESLENKKLLPQLRL
jgi:UDP-N-acetylglucosamine 2-epimerase (non-hydrolysing)